MRVLVFPTDGGEVARFVQVDSLPTSPNPEAGEAYLFCASGSTASGVSFGYMDRDLNFFRATPLRTFQTSAPTVSDDATKGYLEGTLWADTTNGNFYWLNDSTAGAAVWMRILSSSGSLASPGKYFDWDRSPASGPPEVQSGDVLTFEFVNTGPIRSMIGAIQYPTGVGPTVNPVFTIPFAVTSTGAGDADVVFRLHAKYIGSGELTTKADDETLDTTVAVVDTLDRKHEFSITLDKTKIAAADYASFSLERIHTDAADTFTGSVGVFEISEFDPGT